VYIRDSGILHGLLNIKNHEQLAGEDRFPVSENIEAFSLYELAHVLSDRSATVIDRQGM